MRKLWGSKRRRLALGISLVVAFHAAGFLSSISALMSHRTPEGAVAWVVSLNTLPYVTVPAYWLFGRPRFEAYSTARRTGVLALHETLEEEGNPVEELRGSAAPHVEREDLPRGVEALERMVRMPVLGGNVTELLLDGESTFRSHFEGIDRAERYVLVLFFIIRDDELGRELQRRLMRKAAEGVAVHVLYDDLGSWNLPARYVDELEAAGVEVAAFGSKRGLLRRLQVNFRNHRKLMVVDGREGWVGGYNVGVEHLDGYPELGEWRDTHLRIEGPAALALQLAFLEDWHWATGRVLSLSWEPHVAEAAGEDGGEPVLVVPSGPADDHETAGLMIQHAIAMANERIWIGTPYFIPDEAILGALELAVLRGVDVRILIPERSDSRVADLAAMPALDRLLAVGARVFRFTPGFLHHKTFVVDDAMAGVGSVNVVSRSLRLSFEVTALLFDPDAVGGVAASFATDFERSREVHAEELRERSFLRRAAARAAHLMAPQI